MKDTFDRKIDYLRISVTDLCNLRCEYCMPKDGVVKCLHNEIISPERIKEIVSICVSLGINKVRISGGEPLVRKGIIDICKYIKEIDGVKELCLTTNGILLEKYAKELFDAGVDRINVSLDTLNKDKYLKITRGGNIVDVLNGLKKINEIGFKNTKLNVVLIKGFNDDEINDFISFSNKNNIVVRFIELMNIGEAKKLSPFCFISNDIVLNKCPSLKFIKYDGVTKLYEYENAKIGLISPISHKFCSSCSRIRLTSDGKIKPCLHSKEEIDLNNLHGEELKDAIMKSFAIKPKEHHLEEESSSSNRYMNQIGG